MLHLITSPLTYLWLAAVALLLAGRSGRWRAVHIPIGLLFGAALLLMMPLGANPLVALVEGFPSPLPPCNKGSKGPLLLLAGGMDAPSAGREDISTLSLTSIRRTMKAVEVFRADDDGAGRLLISGGGPFPHSEAEVMASLATKFGVPADRIVLDPASNTTWESAQWMAKVHAPKAAPVRVVTSHLHLARASLSLAAHGVTGCVIGADSLYSPPGGLGYLFPQSSALRKAEMALHELAGIAWYRFRPVQ